MNYIEFMQNGDSFDPFRRTDIKRIITSKKEGDDGKIAGYDYQKIFEHIKQRLSKFFNPSKETGIDATKNSSKSYRFDFSNLEPDVIGTSNNGTITKRGNGNVVTVNFNTYPKQGS